MQEIKLIKDNNVLSEAIKNLPKTLLPWKLIK